MTEIVFYDLAAEHDLFRAELDEAYRRVVDRSRFILDREVESFESEFARYCETAEAVGVANGLDALTLSLRALGVGSGDEVIVAAHTFVATWLAVVNVGATPVPCEPDPGRYSISSAGVAPLITTRTRAVIPVHLYGIPAPVDGLAELCRAHKLHLLEDAAQAHGAYHKGRACGSVGKVGCFSFYPSKNLGALGDGGAVITSDSGLAKSLRRLRNYGSSTKYHADEAGWNSRLDELQAAFLRVKLAHLPKLNGRRRALASQYAQCLEGLNRIMLPKAPVGDVPAWHLFVIRAPERDKLRAHLAASGIETAVHYPIPVYRMPPFKRYGPSQRTESDRIASEVLSLPFSPMMPAADATWVCAEIREFFNER